MNPVDSIVRILTAELKQMAHDLRESEALTLQQAEERLRGWSRDYECRLLQECYAPRAQEPPEELSCPECSGRLVRQELRRRWVTCLSDAILVSRWYVRCSRCGHRDYPWDTQQQLRNGYSPSAAEAMCRLSARLDFREAAQELAHLGVQVSVSSLQKQVECWAAGVDVVSEVSPQPLAKGQRWYVTADGCQVPYRDGWHEVKPPDQIHSRPSSRCAIRFYGSMGTVRSVVADSS